MTWLSPRVWFFSVFGLCALLLAVAILYFQNHLNMYPCPLCIFQRVAFIAMGLIALLAALHNPGRKGRIIYGLGISLAGVLGALVAGRHIWLQNLPPDQVPACGPGLDYLMDNFPFLSMLEMVFKGDGSCAEVSWSFLGLNMPGWTMVWYVGLLMVTLWIVIRRS